MHSFFSLFDINRKLGIDACAASDFVAEKKKPLIVFFNKHIFVSHSNDALGFYLYRIAVNSSK